jgi:hypothetical protein
VQVFIHRLKYSILTPSDLTEINDICNQFNSTGNLPKILVDAPIKRLFRTKPQYRNDKGYIDLEE